MNTETAGSEAFARNLNLAFDDMKHARREFNDWKSRYGEVPDEIHRQFEIAVLEVYEEMLPFTVENEEIERHWEQANLDAFPQVCSRVHEVQSGGVRGGRYRPDSQIEIEYAPASTLKQVAQTLEMMATKLGLNVDTANVRKRGVIGNVE